MPFHVHSAVGEKVDAFILKQAALVCGAVGSRSDGKFALRLDHPVGRNRRFAIQYRVVADQGTQQDFGTRLFIKTNIVDVLARELQRPSLQGEHITLGTATDPYQPVEGRYRLTRGALELLRDHANPVSLLTK